jgi:hypothetical protein
VPGNRLGDYRLTVDVHEPRAVLDPFPRDGQVGVFDHGETRIETADGETLESRSDPRSAFTGRAGLRRNLRWDALDSAYFGGYAMWNYLTTPLLLTRDGVEAREGDEWDVGGEVWRRLDVDFPPDVATHSRRQSFYFDARSLLRRHDYVAEVVGRWAHGAHYCDEHVRASGLVFPTRRWVRPVGIGNRALPFPTTVWIELSELRVESAP